MTGGDQESAPQGVEPGGENTPPSLVSVVSVTAVALALWLLVVGLGYSLVGGRFALAAGIGGAIALVNFQMMWVSAARAMEGGKTAPVWTVLRWLGLGGLLLTLVLLVQIDVAGLLVGLSVVVAAILTSAALGLVRG